MGWFIIGIVVVLIGVGLFLFGGKLVRSDHRGDRETGRPLRMIGIVIPIIGSAMVILSLFYIVPPKQVGIPVTFGRVGDPQGSGLHPKAPWTSVEKMDATAQSLDATGDNPTIAKDVDKADVFVHNNVRWAIKEEAAGSLFMEFRDFDRVNDRLVQPMLRESVGSVMATYNPLGDNQPTDEQIADQIKVKLQEKVGDRIVIQAVSVTLKDFSGPTKDRINALNTERGNTRIAAQREETARKEASANKILAESISKDPNVVTSNCLKLVAESAPGTFPAGFQCWSGTSGAVVVPSAK